jgi:minor extracellular protease Epr
MLYAVKVLNHEGLGFILNIVSGIQWAIEQKMNIINISLGFREPSTILKWAIDNAYT